MSDTAGVLAAEQTFFSALRDQSVSRLEEILAEDFTMVALNGSVLDRSSLMTAVGAGYLKFHEIQLVESSARFYPPLAVVVGRTEMSGSLGENPFTASSRYTHVYSRQDGYYRLVAAQGTPILAE